MTSAVLPWSMWPAVPRVSGGRWRGDAPPSWTALHRWPQIEAEQGRAGEVLELVLADGAQVEQQAAVLDAADDGRRAAAQQLGARAGLARGHRGRDRDARHLGDRQRPGAGAGDRLDELEPVLGHAGADEQLAQPCPRARARPRADSASAASVGISAMARARVEVEAQDDVERREVELVDAQGPRQRVTAHRLDRRRPADGDAGLRAAEQLVAAEGDDVAAGGDAVRQRRLLPEQLQVGERPAAQVVDQHRRRARAPASPAPPAPARP